MMGEMGREIERMRKNTNDCNYSIMGNIVIKIDIVIEIEGKRENSQESS